jgi:hypothetical protein
MSPKVKCLFFGKTLLWEPVSKRFSLVKVKAGDPAKSGINRRNTLSILRINHATA